MGKLPKIALAVLLCVAVGVFAWQLWPSPEPVYQGKRLLRWLDDAFWSGGPSGETATAIKSMGTNALPTLLRMIQAKDSAFYHAVATFSRGPSRLLLRAHLADDYRQMAIWGFDALGPTARPAVADLISLLKNDDMEVRATAAYCLGVIGLDATGAAPALTQCLSDAVSSGSGNRETAILKERAATALGKMGPSAREAIPTLTVVTTDSIWYARNAAKAALMRIRSESVVPLIEQLRDTSDPIRWYEAAMLVSDFGTNAEPAIPLLIKALQTNNDLILGHAALALGRINRQPEVCVPSLIPLLSSTSISTRQKSLIALGEFGSGATSAVPAIRRCLTDSDPWVRMRAPAILKEIDPKAAAKAGVN